MPYPTTVATAVAHCDTQFLTLTAATPEFLAQCKANLWGFQSACDGLEKVLASRPEFLFRRPFEYAWHVKLAEAYLPYIYIWAHKTAPVPKTPREAQKIDREVEARITELSTRFSQQAQFFP